MKAVLGSGINKMASSDGFYVDMTSPIFDPDVMNQIYIDVSQGEFTPVVYQASNSTIKAFWRCLDEESSVKVKILIYDTHMHTEMIKWRNWIYIKRTATK